MGFFAPVDNSLVLLRKNGVFTEAPVYVYQGVLYAKHGAGYARLKPNRGTSVPKLTWEEIDLDPSQGNVKFDPFNAFLAAPADKPKRIRNRKEAA